MGKKNLKQIEKIQSIQLDRIGKAEENIKIKIILPILELLGYDKIKEMDFEKNVRDKRADIAILLDKKVKIIIETKRLKENLDKHINQALDYAFQFQVN